MELNALYFHYQTALMKGARLAPQAVEPDHDARSTFDLAAHYAKRITEERRRLGHSGRKWTDLPRALGGWADTPAARID